MKSINHCQKRLNPELSVVVVILTGRKDCLGRCLTALTEQCLTQSTEIIVPCDESALHLVSLSSQFPQVQFLTLKGVSLTYAELRAIGLRKSTGRIVAITEDHCIPGPGWCTQILRAHDAPHAAVGGSVEKKVPDSSLNWAFYLADYLRYMNPIAVGPTHNLTDCNVSYKRTALDVIAPEWEREFHEPTIHAALRDHGQSLWLEPKIEVFQQRDLSLRAAIRDRYTFGRLFASTRFNELTSARRLLYSLLALLVPVVLVARVTGQISRKRRHVGEFVKALPYLILISIVWAAGESLGYLTGRAGESLTPNEERRRETATRRGHEAVV